MLLKFFSKKKNKDKEPVPDEPVPEKPKSDVTVLGYVTKGGVLQPYGVPDKELQNMFLGGEIKSGKTTVMKSMIIQDIEKDRGVLVLDPHMNLVTDLMGMIPKEKHDKIVYISMDSASLFDGWTIRINPIECDNDEERPFVVQSYMHLTESFHGRYWGPRVGLVIRNLVNTLVYIDNYKHSDLIKILTDEKYRQYVLTKVPLKHVKEFWETIFPDKMAAEATGTAYNKLDEIVTTPSVAMILDTVHSSINISEMIDNGNIILVNLQSGTSEELAKFMGSILLHLFSVEGRNKQKKGLDNIRPFSIYVDEAHEFAPQILRELLNRVRKWNARMTIASQSITKFDKTLGGEMASLCTAIALFRTNKDTAKTFEDRMALDANQLVNLNTHQFALYVNANPPKYAVAGTKHMPSIGEDVWMDIAEKSVKKYGQKIDVTKYIPITGGRKGPVFTPLEFFILNTLYLEGRDVTKDEVIAFAQKKFKVTPREVNGALLDTLCSTHRYVEMHNIKDDDGDGNLSLRFSVSSLALNTIYSRAVAGRRAGHDLHLGKLFELMDLHFKENNYCELDRADTNKDKADLLVYSFLPLDVRLRSGRDAVINSDKKPKKHDPNDESDMHGASQKYTQYDHENWSENIVAIEVETAPSKHTKQIIKNFEKNWENGYDVAFIVFNEREKGVIYRALDAEGIDRMDYSVTVDRTVIDLNKNKKVSETAHKSIFIDSVEEMVVKQFSDNDGCTSEKVVLGLSQFMEPQKVRAVIRSLEIKGLIEKSWNAHVTHMDRLKGDGTSRSTSRKEVWIKTDKFPYRKVVENPEDPSLKDKFVMTDGADYNASRQDDKSLRWGEKPKKDDESSTDGKYANTDKDALVMLIDEGTPDEGIILEELKKRGYGVRKNTSGRRTLTRLPKKA